MKKILLGIMVLCLTGCVSIKTKMNIHEDKSMDFKYSYELDMQYFDTEEEAEQSVNMDQETKDMYESKGYSIEAKNEDGIYKVSITKKFDNIDNISNSNVESFDFLNWQETGNDSNMFNLSDNKYKAKFIYDFTIEEGTEDMDMSSFIDLTYTVTLPDKSISNNATTVSEDGKTLTWNLKYGELNTVEYEFTLDGSSSIIPYIIIGGVILLLVILIVIIITKRGKKDNTPIDEEVAIEEVEKPIVEIKNADFGEVIPEAAMESIPEVVPVVNNPLEESVIEENKEEVVKTIVEEPISDPLPQDLMSSEKTFINPVEEEKQEVKK